MVNHYGMTNSTTALIQAMPIPRVDKEGGLH